MKHGATLQPGGWPGPIATPQATRAANRRAWWTLSGACAVAAVLSAVQIYGRQAVAGATPAWPHLLWTNLVAWAPWIPISRLALAAGRRRPLAGPGSGAHLAHHLLLATATATVYLTYLGIFHALVVTPSAVGWAAGDIGRAVLDAWGAFFLVAMLLYAFVAVIGSMLAVRQAPRADRSTLTDAASASTVEAMAPGEPTRERASSPDPGEAGSRAPTQAVRPPGVQPKADPEPAAAGPGGPGIAVPARGRIRYVQPRDVMWLEAAGCYVRVHTRERGYLLRRPLTELCAELAADGMVRVHRSAAVNLGAVAELARRPHGEAVVTLANGTDVRVSRSRRSDLVARLRRSAPRG